MNEAYALLSKRLTCHGIPEHLHQGLVLYLLNGLRPGGYLVAVLTNDLKGAVHLAKSPVTPTNTHNLVRFLEMNAPGTAWGSVEIVERWLEPDQDRPPMPYDGCPNDHGGDGL